MDTSVKIRDAGPVVMVDDSEGDLIIARRCFQRSRLKNEFLQLSSGAEFLAYMEGVATGTNAMPALVLLDINMPGMSGFEVLSDLRSRQAFRAIPIIAMLTTSDNPMDVRKAEALGADGFRTKPIQLAAYIELFNSFLD